MSLDLLKRLVNEPNKRLWSDAELRQLSSAELMAIVRWNVHTTQISDDMKNKIAAHGGVTQSDKQAAVAVRSTPKISRESGCPEEFLNRKGGSFHYTPDKIEYKPLVGDSVSKVNSPIPIPFTSTPWRKNIQQLTALVSCAVDLKNGEWVPADNGSWMEAFGQSTISPASMTLLGVTACECLTESSLWKTKTVLEKNATTGMRKLLFIQDVLQMMAAEMYDYLHCMFFYEVLCGCVKSKNGKFHLNKVYPKDTYDRIEIAPKTPAAQLIQPVYPAIFHYKGGASIAISGVVEDGELKTAIKLNNQTRAVAGGDKSTAMLLSQMKGFSGFTDEFGKRIQFILAATLSAWKRGRIVDVFLETIGDYPLLVSSLEHWLTKEKWVFEEKYSNNTSRYKFYYTKGTAGLAAEQKVHFTEVYRPDSVIVWYSTAHIPTSQEKQKAVDYDFASFSVLRGAMKTQDFIAHVPIYGSYFFQKDEQVVAADNTRTTGKLIEGEGRKLFVYAFSNAMLFWGVASTFKELTLVGWGYPKSGKKWDKTSQERIVEVELVAHTTQASWYNQVIRDCAQVHVAPFSLHVRYSPISNLPYASKKTVQIKQMFVNQEEELYVGLQMSQATMTFDEGEEVVGMLRDPDDDEQIINMDSDSEEELPLRKKKVEKKKKSKKSKIVQSDSESSSEGIGEGEGGINQTYTVKPEDE